MFFNSLFQRNKAETKTSARPRSSAVWAKPRVEQLESRTMLNGDVLLPGSPCCFLETDHAVNGNEILRLLDRASAATPSEDAIIAIVDRNGRILGVRVEDDVSATITGDTELLTFAIDGALAKARTAAFFAHNQAPFTSRTVQFISQTTITQREVESNPNITDRDSTERGPGFVAPIGINAHFPPDIQFTPPVDLFGIEHTNRDSFRHPGPDQTKGTADDITLTQRFNIDGTYVPAGKELFAPESYGFQSGLFPEAQSRGIGTLPGGIPIYRFIDGKPCLVGGIGVFFPGETGFATEENSKLNDFGYKKKELDRSFEAEFIAFAAVGGTVNKKKFRVGTLDGVEALPDVGVFTGRLDLVGITLDVFGPKGQKGPKKLKKLGKKLNKPKNDGPGEVNGTDQVVNPGGDKHIDGLKAPEGWLVNPHASSVDDLTADDVRTMINQAIAEADKTRAAIRLPLDSRAKMVFAVADTTGEVLGLYRMADATIFSIDVAVAKARNVAYYADATALKAIDQVNGLPAGTALTNRTFRFLAEPFFPEGTDGSSRPGPHSILNDGGVNRKNGATVGAPLPASSFVSVLGFDAFNPGTNFRDTDDVANQNGIVFFPGSMPIYKDENDDGIKDLIGGLGVSGDGVDQDDVVTFGASLGFRTPGDIRVDQFFVRGVRLPFQKFNRHPRG